MSQRRTTRKRRPTRTTPPGVDVERIARNAVTLVERDLALLDHAVSKGIPEQEMAMLRERFPIPPSYTAIASQLLFSGPAGDLLRPSAIRATITALEERSVDTARYFPFATGSDRTFCFDRDLAGENGELAVAAIHGDAVEFVAANFGEWLDDIAVELESFVQLSSEVPPRLRKLLVDLGFTFEHPIRATVETGDADALLTLLGRRFEQAGYLPHMVAHLTLHLATMRMECAIGERTFRLPTEEAFRWLRSFRDEDFFGGSGPPAALDRARDLRFTAKTVVKKAPSSKRRVLAARHTFAGMAATEDGLHLLANPHDEGPSLLLGGTPKGLERETQLSGRARAIAASQDGAVWVLLEDDVLLRIQNGEEKVYTLPFPKPRAPWSGLAATGTHAFIYSSQAILYTSAEGIEPIELSPPLGAHEEIRAVRGARRRLTVLRQGRDAAHVSDFRSGRWSNSPPIILSDLVGIDGTAEDAILLARDGQLVHLDKVGTDRVRWDRSAPSAQGANGQKRRVYGVARLDHDLFLATDGGVMRIVQGAVSYLPADGTVADPASLHRFSYSGEPVLFELAGPYLGRWTGRAFEALDMSRW